VASEFHASWRQLKPPPSTTVLITTNGRHDRCSADRCARVARRAVRQALDECSRNPRAKRCNRMWNMSLNTNWESHVVGNLWVRQVARAVSGVGRRGETSLVDEEEAVCCDAERCVVVKASPTSTLVMSESYFLFEVLGLDSRVQFANVTHEWRVRLGSSHEAMLNISMVSWSCRSRMNFAMEAFSVQFRGCKP
jgi:hypothetical protein